MLLSANHKKWANNADDAIIALLWSALNAKNREYEVCTCPLRKRTAQFGMRCNISVTVSAPVVAAFAEMHSVLVCMCSNRRKCTQRLSTTDLRTVISAAGTLARHSANGAPPIAPSIASTHVLRKDLSTVLEWHKRRFTTSARTFACSNSRASLESMQKQWSERGQVRLCTWTGKSALLNMRNRHLNK